MEINFGPRGTLEITDARIIWRNFEGRGDKFNAEGKRNFAVIIPNEEIKEALVNDTNKYGVGWNVKIRPPRDEDDAPFMFLKVNVSFKGRKPNIYLVSGRNAIELDEDTIHRLDRVDISSVNMVIRPYDDEIRDQPFRAAYIQSLEVFQDCDMITKKYAEEEYPGEDDF